MQTKFPWYFFGTFSGSFHGTFYGAFQGISLALSLALLWYFRWLFSGTSLALSMVTALVNGQRAYSIGHFHLRTYLMPSLFDLSIDALISYLHMCLMN